MNHPLGGLFVPSNLAVIGVSRNPLKWGSRVVANTVDMGFSGDVWAVNPVHRAGITGSTDIADVADAGRPIDLAILALPSGRVFDALVQCAKQGVRNAVIPASGFGEVSETGASIESQIKELTQNYPIRVVGPNCFGVYSSVGRFNGTPFAGIPAGRIGLVSQSGNVAGQAFIGARKRGLGFSHCVGLGNQIDVSFAETLDWLARDTETDCVGLYIEGLPESMGGRLVAALNTCQERGKMVVAIKAGSSDAGAAVAQTHTRSLSSDDRVWNEILGMAGAIRVRSVSEMLDVLAFASAPPLPGRRIAVITDGGGDSILAVDEAAMHNLTLPRFSERVQANLDRLMPPDAPRSPGRNPLTLDTAGGVDDDPKVLARCIQEIIDSGEVDAIVAGGLYGTYTRVRSEENEAAELIKAMANQQTVLAFQSPLAPTESEPLQILQNAGIPVYSEMRNLLRALSAYAAPGRNRDSRPMLDEQESSPPADTLLDPSATYRILTEAGVALPPQTLGRDLSSLPEQADRIGYPVCLKVVAPEIVHKSDVGGVRVGIRTVEELESAATEIWRSLPGNDLLIMPSLSPGFEVMLGARFDQQFGPVLVVGRGGIWAEVEADTAVLVGDFHQTRFLEAINGLRCAPMLRGTRGQPALNLEPLAQIAEVLTTIVSDNPDLSIDLNPVFLYEEGCAVADSRIMTSRLSGLTGAGAPRAN